jgi:hypothetical protein
VLKLFPVNRSATRQPVVVRYVGFFFAWSGLDSHFREILALKYLGPAAAEPSTQKGLPCVNPAQWPTGEGNVDRNLSTAAAKACGIWSGSGTIPSSISISLLPRMAAATAGACG